jgi:hypothetical protein
MSISQLSKHIPLRSTTVKFQFEFTFVRLRYSLGGDRPSQTTNHILSSFKKNELFFKIRVVFQFIFIIK